MRLSTRTLWLNILLAPLLAYSQNWSTTGNSIGATEFIGTTNNYDLRIHTNGSLDSNQRMIVTNEGNVGIGMYDGNNMPTVPRSKLMVQNGAIFDPSALLGSGGLSMKDFAISTTSDNIGGYNAGVASFIVTDALHNYGLNSVIVSGSSAAVNYGFTAQIIGDDSYNIGISINCQGNDRLNWGASNHVVGNSSQNYGTWSEADGEDNNSFYSNGDYSESTLANIGVYGLAKGPNSYNVGVYGVVNGDNGSYNAGSTCYGVLGTVNTPGANNFGVAADFSTVDWSQTANFNYAVYGVQNLTTPSGVNAPTNGSVSGTPVNYAGFFDGDIFCSNTYYYSDPKLKTGIKDFGEALEKIKKLKVVSYLFRSNEYPTMNFPSGLQVGLLSTNIKDVFPQLVKHSIQPEVRGVGEKVEFDAVNYNALIPILIRGTQEIDDRLNNLDEQILEIERLRREVEDLKKQLADIRLHENSNAVVREEDRAVLFDNNPNPFDKGTVINYYLPNSADLAKLTVSDLGGTRLLDFVISERGNGSIILEGAILNPGQYLYSLIVDGKIIATKRMIITR